MKHYIRIILSITIIALFHSCLLNLEPDKSPKNNSWEIIFNEINGSTIEKFFLTNNGYIFFQDYFNKGIFRSTDDGKSWELIYENSNKITQFFQDDQDYLYVLKNSTFAGQEDSADYGLYISSDYGSNWNKFELKGVIKQNFYYADCFDVIRMDKNGYFYASGNSPEYDIIIYSSNDRGHSWEVSKLLKNFSNNVGFHIDPFDNFFIVYVSHYDKHEFRFSSDYGESWEFYNLDLDIKEFKYFFSISPGNIFIGNYQTTDYGKTWNFVSLPSVNNKQIIAITSDSANNIYAINTNETIYKSTDNGLTWILYDNNLGEINDNEIIPQIHNIGQLWINKHGNIYAGGAGSGNIHILKSKFSVYDKK